MPVTEKLHCKFAHACHNPGPLMRVPGSADSYCGPHYRMVSEAVFAPVAGTLDLEFTFHAPEFSASRAPWLVWIGVVGKS